MAEFRALDLWQKAEGKNDAQTADLIGVGRSVFSRFRNGLQTLKMRDLLKLQEHTGISPAECAEYYAAAVTERGESDGAQKKTFAAVATAEPEAV